MIAINGTRRSRRSAKQRSRGGSRPERLKSRSRERLRSTYEVNVEIGAEQAPRRLHRVNLPAIARTGPVLVTLIFILGAIIAGIVLARVWH